MHPKRLGGEREGRGGEGRGGEGRREEGGGRREEGGGEGESDTDINKDLKKWMTSKIVSRFFWEKTSCSTSSPCFRLLLAI
jgi:hypothetical protein